MRNSFSRFFFCVLVSLALKAEAGPIWVQTWSDEFNAAVNTGLDGSKWSYDTGGGGYGNGELETYTNRTQNVRHDGAGHLIIEARAETYTGTDGITRNWTSGRFQSGGKFNQAYGRMEALIKIPYGQGIWPAFWMLGNNIGGGWPACGEIDIMENVGFEPNTVHGTLHGPGYSGAGGIGFGYNTGSALTNAYHLYAVEWEPNIVRWYIDNTLYEERTPADLPGGTTWVYDHPFFIIFNLAVGGAWPGSPDGTTVFPQQMLVDYVRVYSRDTTQAPYSGTAQPIPGTVQCEDFDDGGPGVAYSDTTVLNQGGLNTMRTSEQVDLEACTDTGGGYDLGWTVAGEWLEYTVNVSAPGSYAFTARVASQGAGGTFHLQMDAVDVVNSTLAVPDTGGWQNWQTIGPVSVNLAAGQHVLQIHMDTNGGTTGGIGNLNWINFTSLITPTPSSTVTFTRTATGTSTRTRTSTPSPSGSPSASPTITPSRTPTHTVTGSSTRTGTTTRTVSATRTASVSASPTETDVPPGSTLTDTPSISPTSSETLTATLTESDTHSPTASSSATPTTSNTVSNTSTETPIDTVTSTVTPTPSNTVPVSETDTPTLTVIVSASSTVTASATATSTKTPGPSTATATSSPTSTGTAVATAASPPLSGGPGKVLKAVAYPHPCYGPTLHLALFLEGPADGADLSLYTEAMTCVLKERLKGPFPAGWAKADVDVSRLPDGLYFLRCGQAKNRLLLLR